MKQNTPYRMTNFERWLYQNIQSRAEALGVTIAECCRRAKVSPTTYSRWAQGHTSGLLRNVAKIVDLLTQLEIKRLENIEARAREVAVHMEVICREAAVPMSEYYRWADRGPHGCEPDPFRLAVMDEYLTQLETKKNKEKAHDE